MLVVVMLMLPAAVAWTDPVKIVLSYKDLGTYKSQMLTAVGEDWMFHAEDSTSLDYWLALVEKDIASGVRLGLRVDDTPFDFWIRPYVAYSDEVCGVKAKARWLAGGIESAPPRFDLWTNYPVNDWLSVNGWEFIQNGKKPEHWYGPKVGYKDLSVWYAKNLRGGGDNAFIASWSHSF